MSIRSYYLLRDGVTITTDHPIERYKSVARAGTKREATKVFNSRFEKNPDGSYGDRKNNGTTRRMTVRRTEEKRIPLPHSVTEAVRAEGRLGQPGEVLDDEQEASMLSALGSPLNFPPRIVQAVVHIGGVKLTVPQDTAITLTSKGEVVVTFEVTNPPTENPTDLLFAGKVD